MAKEVGSGQALAFLEGGGNFFDTCINYKEDPILIQDLEVETNDPHDGGYELS